MKKTLIILYILIQTLTIHSQSEQNDSSPCLFQNKIVDSNNYNQLVNHLEYLLYTSNGQELNDLLNCLFSIDSSDLRLFCYKAILFGNNENDTSGIELYKNCIKTDFMLKEAYYNIGATYINYFFSRKINDSALQLTLSQQKRLLDIAEENMWKSTEVGMDFAYFTIGEIQEWKSELLLKPKPTINIETDTLQIVAEILDCGEFGGHIEKIIITYNNVDYYATYYSDSIHCSYEPSRRSSYMEYNGLIKVLNKNTYEDFITFAINYSIDKDLMSNAPFRIAFVEKENVISKRINETWPYYLEFRKKLFGF